MINPNPKFRADPTRAVYVHGLIDEELVHRLTPQILNLQHSSRSPITVYIDSRGGSVASYRSLWSILTASDQNLAEPCHILTVVTSRAASAAADLLVSGNYAIAYPESSILYHGVTTVPRQPLTTEDISSEASDLRQMSEDFATDLMNRLELRLMFRFLDAKAGLDRRRKGAIGNSLSAAEHFEQTVYDRLSQRARALFEAAKRRQERYEELLAAARGAHLHKTTAKTEAGIIKAIVDFEVRRHKDDPGWTFRKGGLAMLNEDFFVLGERLSALESGHFDGRCIDAFELILSPSDLSEIERAPATVRDQMKLERVRPVLEPLWSFFAALCHALQEGENELTATDAYHLGLVDEIVGLEGYTSYRYLAEV